MKLKHTQYTRSITANATIDFQLTFAHTLCCRSVSLRIQHFFFLLSQTKSFYEVHCSTLGERSQICANRMGDSRASCCAIEICFAFFPFYFILFKSIFVFLLLFWLNDVYISVFKWLWCFWNTKKKKINKKHSPLARFSLFISLSATSKWIWLRAVYEPWTCPLIAHTTTKLCINKNLLPL